MNFRLCRYAFVATLIISSFFSSQVFALRLPDSKGRDQLESSRCKILVTKMSRMVQKGSSSDTVEARQAVISAIHGALDSNLQVDLKMGPSDLPYLILKKMEELIAAGKLQLPVDEQLDESGKRSKERLQKLVQEKVHLRRRQLVLRKMLVDAKTLLMEVVKLREGHADFLSSEDFRAYINGDLDTIHTLNNIQAQERLKGVKRYIDRYIEAFWNGSEYDGYVFGEDAKALSSFTEKRTRRRVKRLLIIDNKQPTNVQTAIERDVEDIDRLISNNRKSQQKNRLDLIGYHQKLFERLLEHLGLRQKYGQAKQMEAEIMAIQKELEENDAAEKESRQKVAQQRHQNAISRIDSFFTEGTGRFRRKPALGAPYQNTWLMLLGNFRNDFSKKTLTAETSVTLEVLADYLYRQGFSHREVVSAIVDRIVPSQSELPAGEVRSNWISLLKRKISLGIHPATLRLNSYLSSGHRGQILDGIIQKMKSQSSAGTLRLSREEKNLLRNIDEIMSEVGISRPEKASEFFEKYIIWTEERNRDQPLLEETRASLQSGATAALTQSRERPSRRRGRIGLVTGIGILIGVIPSILHFYGVASFQEQDSWIQDQYQDVKTAVTTSTAKLWTLWEGLQDADSTEERASE